MKIVFRTDAALHIGVGHVMRCLTLASAIKSKGVSTHFVCREFEGHLAEKILEEGHQLHLLPCSSPQPSNGPLQDLIPPHAGWLGVSWENDLHETQKALSGLQIDWLIVDHYAIDYRWEREMRRLVNKIMIIDDLADRVHDCDLLLDQNPGRKNTDYSRIVPNDTVKLTGSTYALLKNEYSRLRSVSLSRRSKSTLKRVLISMGGVDKDNITSKVLSCLNQHQFCHNLHFTVVLGHTALHIAAVKKLAHELSFHTEVLVGVSSMAELMSNSDLAIGAAGGTAIERCCVGLPSVIMVLAENQKPGAQALEKLGAAIVVNEAEAIDDIALVLENLLAQPALAKAVSDKACLVTEGDGVALIMKYLGIVSC